MLRFLLRSLLRLPLSVLLAPRFHLAAELVHLAALCLAGFEAAAERIDHHLPCVRVTLSAPPGVILLFSPPALFAGGNFLRVLSLIFPRAGGLLCMRGVPGPLSCLFEVLSNPFSTAQFVRILSGASTTKSRHSKQTSLHRHHNVDADDPF